MRKQLIVLLMMSGLSAVLLLPGSGIGQQGGGKKGGGGGGQDQQDQGFGGKKNKGGGKKGGGFDPSMIPGGGFGGKGGGGAGFGGKGGGGGFNPMGMMDPNTIFDMLTGGENFLYISKLPMGSEQVQQWANDSGITSGALTRDQFNLFWKERGARVMSTLGLNAPKGGGGYNDFNGMNFEQLALLAFRGYDTNGDNVLNEDEMPNRLRAALSIYDKDHNGEISFEEFKAYYRDMQNEVAAAKKNQQQGDLEDELDRRPVVYRAGKLPKELPPWFTQLDTDGDGQIGLYEWMRANKAPEEFQAMDRNGDGLLTAEEVLWYLKINPGESESNKMGMMAMGGMNMPNIGMNFGGGPGGKKGGPGGGGRGDWTGQGGAQMDNVRGNPGGGPGNGQKKGKKGKGGDGYDDD